MNGRELDRFLEIAKERYPIGTKYIPLDGFGNPLDEEQVSDQEVGYHFNGIYVNSRDLVYHFNSENWAEVIERVGANEPELNVIL
jgi:hypothetical protein